MKFIYAAAAFVLTLVGFSIAVVPVAHANDYPLNPDRFTSLGFDYEGYGFSGKHKVPEAGAEQDTTLGWGRLAVDMRIPTSNSFTLEVALGLAGYNLKSDSSPTMFNDKYELGGGYFRIGVRHYFNKSAKASDTSGL